MAKKSVKSLPILSIADEFDGSEIRLIRLSYVYTALQGLQIYALTKGASQEVKDEIARLLAEVSGAKGGA